MIRVFVKAGFCAPCTATLRDLVKEGIEHEVVLLDEVDDAQIEAWKSYGHYAAPIVVTPNGTWSGYRPDRIKQLKEVAA